MICTKKYTCKNNNNKKKTIYETKTGKQKHNKVTKTEESTKKPQTEVSSPVFWFLNGLCVHLLK